MQIEREIEIIRTGVAWSRMEHVAHLRLSGEDAFALLDRTVAAQLLLRDGQVIQSLLLHDDGRPFADIHVGRSDEDFFLTAEGPAASQLVPWLRDHAPAAARFHIELLDDTHEAIALHGPYAWELLADLFGAEIIGMPYGSLFQVDGWPSMRAGKTGEFGYELLVPREQASAAHARIAEAGARFDLARVGLEALDHCALENWFFNIRAEGQAGLTPLELQLQWRISYLKDYAGAEALRKRRTSGITQRITYVVTSARMSAGDRVLRDEREIGRVVTAGFCRPREEWVGLALVDLPLAHSGLDGLFLAPPASEPSPLRTISPPALYNRSLYVSAQRHSYFTRHDDEFPPLAPPRAGAHTR